MFDWNTVDEDGIVGRHPSMKTITSGIVIHSPSAQSHHCSLAWRLERASLPTRVTLHLVAAAPGDATLRFWGLSISSRINGQMPRNPRRKRMGPIEMRLFSVQFMHDTCLLVSPWPIFNSSYLPSNKELPSVRVSRPSAPRRPRIYQRPHRRQMAL